MKDVNLPPATIRLMRELTRKRKTTQPELQSALRLSAPTVFRAVNQLRDLGILLEGDQVASEARGRPAVELRLRPKGYCVFSLVIRSDESWLYLVDAHGNTKQLSSIPISGLDSYEQALTLYAREIGAMADKARHEYDLNAGVGVSFAGSVDPETGFLTTPSRFPDWRRRPFASDLTERTGLHCSVDNDTTALGRAILWFSSSEAAHSFALVNIDFGLGAGFCFEGHIHTGQKRVPSGLAHTTAFGWSQDLCRCGRQGCLETVLSIGGVLKQAAAGGIKLDRSEPPMSIAALQNLEHVAQTENGLAARLLQQTGERAAIVGASIARVLNLPMIVFAGGFIRTSEIAWSALDQEMTRQTMSGDLPLSWRRYDNLVTNEHPEALGATAVALDELRRSRVVTILNPSFTRPQPSFTISKAEEESAPF